MTSPDIQAADQFLAANARVLERRKFERAFRDGDAGPVRDAVAAYRNPDGGFGHALEPDGRCPGSQPLAIDFALRSLLDSGAWDTALADGACAWLAAHAPAGGGVVFVDPSIEGWPHAPWWVPEAGGPASPSRNARSNFRRSSTRAFAARNWSAAWMSGEVMCPS